MDLHLDPSTFRDLLADPRASENLSAAGGSALVIVTVGSAQAAVVLKGLDITAVASVVVAVVPDPGALPAGGYPAADLILTEDPAATAPFVAPAQGIDAAIKRISAALESNPVAGAALALLLRSAAGLSTQAALIAESATYSALQAGAEFCRWRAGRPLRAIEDDPGRVEVERTGSRFEITLARPGRRNAIDWRMRDALADALATAVLEPERQVVLRGLGPDFCAGGDLDEFGSRPDPAIAHLTRMTRSPARLLHTLAARTTVHLHGACLGAGIELPVFASRVTASEDCRIGLPELALGLVPGAGGTVSLPGRIGRWRTAYLALTGCQLDARQALRWGLVDEISADPAGR